MNHLATSKEDILAASRDLIKENGWAAVSIRAVASRCSVSAGTIYNYYDGYYGLSPKNNIISNNNIIIDITPPDYFVGASYDGAATEMFTIPFSTEIGDMTIDVRIEQEG